VTATAIQAAAAHLGTLRDGRKTIIVISEGLGTGYGGDLHQSLEMVRTANDSNTAVHVLDPRGLMASGIQTSLLDTLARGTGGDVHRANDMGTAVRRIVDQATATYLLGYRYCGVISMKHTLLLLDPDALVSVRRPSATVIVAVPSIHLALVVGVPFTTSTPSAAIR
jgi:hypothetical protein